MKHGSPVKINGMTEWYDTASLNKFIVRQQERLYRRHTEIQCQLLRAARVPTN